MEEKSNEITAIPELLGRIQIKGSIVTIDAMRMQAAIAEKIKEKHAEYIETVRIINAKQETIDEKEKICNQLETGKALRGDIEFLKMMGINIWRDK